MRRTALQAHRATNVPEASAITGPSGVRLFLTHPPFLQHVHIDNTPPA